jgi:chloride channel 3/4/5
MLTKRSLPATAPGLGDKQADLRGGDHAPEGKSMYMAAGSGIPEIKTILSGFVIPHFLDLKVLIVKAVGATFIVATGACLGKEGPFVHISTCVAWLVAQWFPKYRENGRKLREILSAGCSSGLSVAFGAPIGGVLFSYEVSHLLYLIGGQLLPNPLNLRCGGVHPRRIKDRQQQLTADVISQAVD